MRASIRLESHLVFFYLEQWKWWLWSFFQWVVRVTVNKWQYKTTSTIYIYKHSIGMKGKSIKTHSLYIHLAMLLWTKFQTIVPFRSLPKWYHSMSVYWYSLSVYCLNELWQFIISKQFTKHTFNHLNGVFDSYSHCSISYKFSVIFLC